MRIEVQAPGAVAAALAALGRTEDAAFSPSGRRLALAAFLRDRLLVLDVTLSGTVPAPGVAFTSGVLVASPDLCRPHGVDFLDDDTLIVGNRGGDVVVLDAPRGSADVPEVTSQAQGRIASGPQGFVQGPGSVRIERADASQVVLVVCNNVSHVVSRHVLDRATYTERSREVIARRWLVVPDGVARSRDGAWLAVSNHDQHCVALYRGDTMGADAAPDALLRGLAYPHGLCFTADGAHLLVADAGAPFVHRFDRGDGWNGVRYPAASLRVSDADAFAQAATTRDEGGPKGLALDPSGRVLVTTTVAQPLTCHAAAPLLVGGDAFVAAAAEATRTAEQLLLDRLSMVRDAEHITKSISWRITAPVRAVRRFFIGGR